MEKAMQIEADLVEVRPLKPFVGSYRCSLADADMIDNQVDENELGQLIKVLVPRKKFIGLISVERPLYPQELDQIKRGVFQLRPGEEISEDGITLVEHPEERTVKVPAKTADSLIERGLAELVKGPRRGKSAV